MELSFENDRMFNPPLPKDNCGSRKVASADGAEFDLPDSAAAAAFDVSARNGPMMMPAPSDRAVKAAVCAPSAVP